MKRFAILTVSAIIALGAIGFAVGCKGGGGSSTTAPSSSSSAATTFTTQLAANNEVPPITNAEANVTGATTITLHTTKDASGNITAATVDFQISASGFPAGSTVTAAHIHPGGAGTNGSILINTGLNSGELAIVAGGGSITKNGISVPTDQAKSMMDNPGNYYFNVHSALNPNGVARSQLGGGSSAGSGGSSGDPGAPIPY